MHNDYGTCHCRQTGSRYVSVRIFESDAIAIVIYFADIYFVTKQELQKRIGQRIIEERQKKGWSQSDLARACNKDRQAMEKLENGKVNPTLFTLYEVSQALGVSLADLTKI